MLSPTEVAPASWAPRLAASISPGPPPVITAKPASPIARADLARPRVLRVAPRACAPSRTRRPPGRRSASASKPWRSSRSTSSSRSASVRVEATRGDSAQMISSSGVAGSGGCGSFIAASGSRPRPRLPWQVLMEASERPQLPLDQTAGDGTVRVVEDRLVIERLTVDDAGVGAGRARAAGRGSARRPRRSTTAIEIGARVIESEGTAANVDYVRAELERRPRRARPQARRHARRGRRGARRADRGDLRRRAQRLGPGADQGDRHRARRASSASSCCDADRRGRLATRWSRCRSGSTRSCSRPRSATAPRSRSCASRTRTSRARCRRQVHELKEHLARLLDKDEHELELAEAEAAGTRKGITFEERVHDGDRGDRRRPRRRRHAHRRRAGRGRGQEGRHAGRDRRRATAPSQGRIVFEAKDKRLSKNERLGRAQRGDGGARGVVRACSSSPARRTSRPGARS